MTKDDAIKWLCNLNVSIGEMRHQDLWCYSQAILEIVEMIDEMPSANVVKLGEWKKKPERVVSYGDIYNVNIRYCSECGWEIRNPGWLKCEWYFCPNCGADMRGVEK